MPDDWELLERWRQTRDEAAFAEIVSRHVSLVYNAARRMLGGPGREAEDVTQAVFLLLAQKAGKIPRRGALVGWLFRATQFCCRNVRKEEGRRKAREREAAMSAISADGAAAGHSSGMEETLDEALGRLAEKERAAILLRYLEGKSAAETAAALAVSVEAVEKRLERGLRKLRERFAAKGFAVPAAGVAAMLAAESAKAAPAGLAGQAGGVIAGGSPAAAGIAKGAAAMMMAATVKMALVAACVVAATLAVAAATVATRESAGPPAAAMAPVLPGAPATQASSATAPATLAAKSGIRGLVCDVAGLPVAGAIVQTAPAQGKLGVTGPQTVTGADGRFVLQADEKNTRTDFVWAKNADGTQMGIADRADRVRNEMRNDVTITLKPPRDFPVTVKDEHAAAIADASVAAAIFPFVLAETRTDAAGRAILRVPADAPLLYIFAVKPNVGLDYFVFWQKQSVHKDPYHLAADFAGSVDFVLNGVSPLTVTVEDEAHKPIAGAAVYPWYFEKPKKGEDFNLGSAFTQLTDERGQAAFAVVPVDNSKGLNFWVRHESYTSMQRWLWDASSKKPTLTATLVAKVHVTGRVIGEDGLPVAGAKVRAGGDGYQFDDFQGETTSQDDGTFAFDVNPEAYYVFVAQKNSLVSPPARQVIRRKADAVELKLETALLVFGKVTAGKQDEPVSRTVVTLYLYDENYDKLPAAQQLPGGIMGRKAIAPTIGQYVMTDEKGSFDFFTCPGQLQTDCFINGDRNIQNFVLADANKEVRIHFDAAQKLPPVRGQVVRADKPGAGVAEVELNGAPLDLHERGLAEPHGVSGRDGLFEINRAPAGMMLHAMTADGSLAAIVQVRTEDDNLTIRLVPTTHAAGRLVDKQGKPLPGLTLQCGIRVSLGKSWSLFFMREAATDNDGKFTLDGLLPGTRYDLQQIVRPAGPPGVAGAKFQRLSKTTFDAGGKDANLGDITVDP